MSEGKFKKLSSIVVTSAGEKIRVVAMQEVDEARKDLLKESHFEGDDTDATTAICISIKKWRKWFGEEKR